MCCLGNRCSVGLDGFTLLLSCHWDLALHELPFSLDCSLLDTHPCLTVLLDVLDEEGGGGGCETVGHGRVVQRWLLLLSWALSLSPAGGGGGETGAVCAGGGAHPVSQR